VRLTNPSVSFIISLFPEISMNTTVAKKETVTHDWKIVDATDQILGRLAVKIANALRGRDKPIYTPHVDTGDYVIVINADKVKLTGSKEEDKKYMFYSGYMGNEKYRSVKDFRESRPEFIITNAVKGMLPKNKLAYSMLTKLRVYRGEDHPHTAQQPTPLSV
jgi:large subunit ribosomal protein L13